jgi:hypothetical protein
MHNKACGSLVQNHPDTMWTAFRTFSHIAVRTHSVCTSTPTYTHLPQFVSTYLSPVKNAYSYLLNTFLSTVCTGLTITTTKYINRSNTV